MASAQSLTNMILAVRRRANIESQVGFISDAEITEYLNYCLSDLYDQLVQAGGQPWYRNSYTFTAVNNTSAYSLPTDFYRLVSVDIALGGGLVISARPYMEAERNRFRWYYQGWFAGRPVFYRLLGNQINFIPTPSGSYSITLNYYPTFTKLVSGSDTFDGVNGWEELAVWKAAAYCKAKGDEDPGYCEAQAAKLQERIDALAAQRDAENPERVHDVTVDLYPWY
ncbi:MAG: hypothetical protein EBR82_12200 [Caulobacteraceae bacterium]|nr:hypothetical protein [Caulobacteraceae bacterium]